VAEARAHHARLDRIDGDLEDLEARREGKELFIAGRRELGEAHFDRLAILVVELELRDGAGFVAVCDGVVGDGDGTERQEYGLEPDLPPGRVVGGREPERAELAANDLAEVGTGRSSDQADHLRASGDPDVTEPVRDELSPPARDVMVEKGEGLRRIV